MGAIRLRSCIDDTRGSLGSLLSESVTMEEFEYLLGLNRAAPNEQTPAKRVSSTFIGGKHYG